MNKLPENHDVKSVSPRRGFRGFITSIIGASSALMLSAVSFAAEGDLSGGLGLSFDVAELMTVTQPLIASLMPIVYVVAGLGLAFTVADMVMKAFK